MNLINLESGQAPLFMPLTKLMRCTAGVKRIHYEDSHSSMSTREEFLQDIVTENIPIEDEGGIHPNGRSMRIYGLIQGNSVLAETLLVSTNNSYFSKLTGRLKPMFWLTISLPPRTYIAHQGRVNTTRTYLVQTRHFICCLDQRIVLADSWTVKSDTSNKKKYTSIQENYVGNTLKCNKLNKCLRIYYMVDYLKIHILRDHNYIQAKFRLGGDDTNLYLLKHMNAFTLEHVILWKNDTNTYAENDKDIRKWINPLLIASSTDELNIQLNEKFYLMPVLDQGGMV